MKILLPEYGLTCDTLLALLPSRVKELYEIECNRKLNLIRFSSYPSASFIHVSVPLGKVHLIKGDEVAIEIIADTYSLTIFLKIDHILLLIF